MTGLRNARLLSNKGGAAGQRQQDRDSRDLPVAAALLLLAFARFCYSCCIAAARNVRPAIKAEPFAHLTAADRGSYPPAE
jgi:hypothetical protein